MSAILVCLERLLFSCSLTKKCLVCAFCTPHHPDCSPSRCWCKAAIGKWTGTQRGVKRVLNSVAWVCLTCRNQLTPGGLPVDKGSNAVIRNEPWSTSGNLKWNGTSPSCIAIAITSRRCDVGWVSCVVSHCPVAQALDMLENTSSTEAATCTKTYLIVASMARRGWHFEKRGMVRVLISSPVQALTGGYLRWWWLFLGVGLVLKLVLHVGFISRGRS